MELELRVGFQKQGSVFQEGTKNGPSQIKDVRRETGRAVTCFRLGLMTGLGRASWSTSNSLENFPPLCPPTLSQTSSVVNTRVRQLVEGGIFGEGPAFFTD